MGLSDEQRLRIEYLKGYEAAKKELEKTKEYAARKLRSKTGAYTKIIEVAVPIRFYWAPEGFDGIEFGPFQRPVSRYQLRLISEALDVIMQLMGGDEMNVSTITKDSPTEVPDVFLRAFQRHKKEE